MMVQVDIIALAFLVVTIVLVTFLAPMIWQFRKTAKGVDALIDELRSVLPPVMGDLQKSMERVNQITEHVEKGTAKAQDLVDSVEALTGSLRQTSNFVRQDIFRYAEIAGSLLTGIQTASEVFFQEPEQEETSI